MSNKGGLRIPFPDYDYADEKGKTPIYIEKVNDCWGAYMPRPKCSITFNADRGVKLPEFIQDIKETLDEMKIEYVFKCQIRDDAISRIARNQLALGRIQGERN